MSITVIWIYERTTITSSLPPVSQKTKNPAAATAIGAATYDLGIGLYSTGYDAVVSGNPDYVDVQQNSGRKPQPWPDPPRAAANLAALKLSQEQVDEFLGSAGEVADGDPANVVLVNLHHAHAHPHR